ncbi:RICIN domain-containing protein [Cellulomonas sp. NS3]|uniref:RICIN domain-containing protein n=1 Tax=Cellulomonas sp. NS3 TaxID=2973977 RepID=UPI0021633068|nr:RICIN domain-containing protein [Cellulomonas sp. NS3]
MTSTHPRARGAVAALGAAAVVAGLTGTAPAAAAPPAAAPAPAAPAPGTPGVTVRPDPTYQGAPFEGWGTSLVWFANATGDYPDEVRDALADLVFGDEGLNLNIARYNIGGGNAPDVPDYLRPGGAVEGWWAAPEGTTRTDTDWWSADDPADWNEDADQTQRWWVDRIKDDVTHWETFSNSPPWFQTVSGYVSGGFDASAEQVRADRVTDFAEYVVGVTERLEDAHGITVDTVDPLNEPNTSYWRTTLGPDGNPTGGRQEGAHVGPERQQEILTALAQALEGSSTGAAISAMDETNPGTFATNWNAYTPEVRDLVAQLNVHTYGTGQRTTVRDIAKAEDKPLWMSEVEGSWGNGQDFESMVPGLGMADRIVDDLRELEPTAWVFWQPVEDYDNMKPGGESAAGANWGSIQLPFDCTAEDTLETCPIYTNTKFDTVRNFTHFIEPGDRLVAVDDPASVAAVDDEGATVVHLNETTEARAVTLDLSAFGKVSRRATVTPVVTSAQGALVEGAPVRVQDARATLEVPAQSVTTFVVDGVRGVADDAALVQNGHTYRLQGVQSGLSLATAGDDATGAVIRTTDAAAPDQLWALTQVDDGTGENERTSGTNRAQYAVTSAADGRRLAVVDGAVVLVPASGEPDEGARWILSTTGNGTFTLVDVATGRNLEVLGQATADGSPVSTWLPNSGANQLWRVVDETVLDVQQATAFTTPGTAPELPATVVPVFRDGARGTLPVTWKLSPYQRWDRSGTVTLSGTATDALGSTHRAEVVVTVDTLLRTEPARAKTYVGGVPELPATVVAVGRTTGAHVERPVTWDADGAVFDAVGTVELTGTADAGDGDTLPATVRVQVTEPGAANAALTPGTVAAATFTEPGYSAAGTVNGDLTDKAWSNWQSGRANAADTLTVTLPASLTVSGVAVHFYRDGGDSHAQTVTVQTRAADGTWVDAGDPVTVPTGTPTAPVATVPVPPVDTDAVRVVLAARPSQHMTVSEVELLAHAPGVGSDATLTALAVDGTPVPGFDPAVTDHVVGGVRGVATVTAVAADPYATVEIRQPTRRDPTARVTVTSEDGSATTTYTVTTRR